MYNTLTGQSETLDNEMGTENERERAKELLSLEDMSATERMMFALAICSHYFYVIVG